MWGLYNGNPMKVTLPKLEQAPIKQKIILKFLAKQKDKKVWKYLYNKDREQTIQSKFWALLNDVQKGQASTTI